MRIETLPILAAALLAAAVASAQTVPSAATSTAPAVPAPGPRIDPQALHIALSSLLLAATKMAIEDAIKRGHVPDSNAAAHVGEPDYLTQEASA